MLETGRCNPCTLFELLLSAPRRGGRMAERNSLPGELKVSGKGRPAVVAAIVLIAVALLLPSTQYHFGIIAPTSDINGNRAKNGANSTGGHDVDREAFTFQASGNLSLRFYNSTSPANGKIFGLQKGAVMVEGKNETIGEGAGFGAPVLNWSGRTYFSRTARTERIEGGLSKTFVLDTLEVGPTYDTSFVPVEAVGEVEVQYRVNGPVLSIEANLSGIPRNATLMILNEQAGSIYYHATDFESYDTVVDFSWRNVTGRCNYLLDSRGWGFRVDYTPDIYNGTTLHLGRETAPRGFDWAGLDYAVDLSAFDGKEFSYQVRLVGG